MTLRRRRAHDEPIGERRKSGQIWEWVRYTGLLAGFLSAGIGLAAHGVAYLRAANAKARADERIEMRLENVETSAAHSEQLLEHLDNAYVTRKEMTARDQREEERDKRLDRLEHTMDDIDVAITRLALRAKD